MSDIINSPTSIHPALTKPNEPPKLPQTVFDEAVTPSVTAQSFSGLNGLFSKLNPGDNLRREQNVQFGSLNAIETNFPDNDLSESSTDASTTFSAATSVESDSVSVPSTLLFLTPAFQTSQTSHKHSKNALSVDSIPRQTIMKALASSTRQHNPQNLSLADMKSPHTDRPGTASSQKLNAALSNLAQRNTPSTARFPSLQSPCFYHERFDDAVNIDKVLEEINGEQSMSHSRLIATATGVREVSKQLQRRPIKRAVRNVMIVTKARDNELVHLTKDLACWLMSTPRYGSDLGVNVYVDAKLRNSKRFGAAALIESQPRFQHMLKYWSPDLCWSQPEKFDLVLTLGGDGTVLFTSWLFQRVVPPILSFSLGSLGFLTGFEYDRFKEHLNKIMGEEGMRVNLRMRFTCTIYRDGKEEGQDAVEGEQFEVLNELVIDRGPSSYISNLELYGDNELLTVVQADGCIFSTPTGSTAYSLSAGGSLVHPDIPAILLTPICPHTLSFRPMILSDTLLLRVSIPRSSRATAYCSFDGKGRVELKQGDHVTIAASQYPFPTVVSSPSEWFDSVSRTLRWNTRGAMQKAWDGGEENKEQEVEWDIDTDSACYGSEESSLSASPLRRQMSMLGM
ncbi:ATP-NAD kinase [Sclerotinia borealis F-4128]|uniref:ATP-NAD kinase n=1 Tax=Sclerotinia borealis (strain F-4128) TaxID=1432307 RepID=W9CMJ8_SCLBF|nr:ATP-NAD kinase [Sclerotinia borealis F-4128]